MSKQIRVSAILNGQPFRIEAEDIRLGTIRSIMKANGSAIEEWKDHPQGDTMAMLDSLLPALLKIAALKDPAWKGRSVEDLEDALTLDEMSAMMEAFVEVAPGIGDAPEASGDPLARA